MSATNGKRVQVPETGNRERSRPPASRRTAAAMGRRDCLRAAASVAGALGIGAPATLRTIGSPKGGGLPARPNLLMVITDQERYPQHWPTDSSWLDANFPARQRLAANGLTFRNAFCNSAMCSPSRATLFTGLFSEQHRVKRTLTYGGSWSVEETPLPVCVQNMARMLASANYRVVLAGKWHLSKSDSGGAPSVADVGKYGFTWLKANTAGEATEMQDFGGGCANHDEDIKSQALEFLNGETVERTASSPFCLILSLANPHDVLSYPLTWNNEDPQHPGCFNYRDTPNMFDRIPISGSFGSYLSNYSDDLGTKPTVQAQSRQLYLGLGSLTSDQDQKNYFNFYAYLQKLVDGHIMDVLNRLDSRGLTDSTVVVRLSDHGEMGLSHQLRQKMFNVYEEAIHVPLVFSNRILFPAARTTDSWASLADVMPTLASLANVPNRDRYRFQGYDLTPVFSNPALTVQDRVLYVFDDEKSGLAAPPEPGFPIEQPNHIRCIRMKDSQGAVWKYARYFDPSGQAAEQYEMYRLYKSDGSPDDPDELENKAGKVLYHSKELELKAALAALESEKMTAGDAGCRTYLPLTVKSGSQT